MTIKCELCKAKIIDTMFDKAIHAMMEHPDYLISKLFSNHNVVVSAKQLGESIGAKVKQSKA